MIASQLPSPSRVRSKPWGPSPLSWQGCTGAAESPSPGGLLSIDVRSVECGYVFSTCSSSRSKGGWSVGVGVSMIWSAHLACGGQLYCGSMLGPCLLQQYVCIASPSIFSRMQQRRLPRTTYIVHDQVRLFFAAELPCIPSFMCTSFSMRVLQGCTANAFVAHNIVASVLVVCHTGACNVISRVSFVYQYFHGRQV